MTLTTQSKDANPATSTLSRVGHWARVAVMFLSLGFIFPHAMTEDDDIAKHRADKDPSVKKQ